MLFGRHKRSFQMKREISKSEGDLIEANGPSQRKSKGVFNWLSNFFTRKHRDDADQAASRSKTPDSLGGDVDEQQPSKSVRDSKQKLVRRKNSSENMRRSKESLIDQPNLTPPIEDRLSPEKSKSGSLESQLDKSTASEPELGRELANTTATANTTTTTTTNTVKSSPLKMNMMMPSDLHSELSRKLSKTRPSTEQQQQTISSSSLKSDPKPQVAPKPNQPGKLDASKTDKIKIEMRLPGMIPPGGKMALPGLHESAKLRSKSVGATEDAKKEPTVLDTSHEQHKIQLRPKNKKRAPTKEHRRSKALSAFPNELDVIDCMDIQPRKAAN